MGREEVKEIKKLTKEEINRCIWDWEGVKAVIVVSTPNVAAIADWLSRVRLGTDAVSRATHFTVFKANWASRVVDLAPVAVRVNEGYREVLAGVRGALYP